MRHENMIGFRMGQIKAMFLMTIALFVSLFSKKRRIWLVAERGVDARDNGYVFFLYMKKEHPEIETYYVITDDSPDRERLRLYENSLVSYRTFRHYVLLWCAETLVSTHQHGYFPFGGLGVWIHSIFPFYRNKCHVMIQHGITQNYIPCIDYQNAPIDLITAALKPEREFFISAYHFPADSVALTGFCRFDNLINNVNSKQILLMPTWREWLYKKDAFFASQYLERYLHLLQSEKLHSLLEKHNATLVFYPHHEVQKYISYFKEHCTNSNIIIADKQHYDVQELLKSSALLLTDYSSVFFDFAYMQKPIIFYQFDRERFRKEHYAAGWYDYDNGVGPCLKTEEDCLNTLEQYITNNCEMEPLYLNKVKELFIMHDTSNCMRVYNAIDYSLSHKRTFKRA